VLDILASTGTTVVAAERVGRLARALEAQPRLVDVAVPHGFALAMGGLELTKDYWVSFPDGYRASASTPPSTSARFLTIIPSNNDSFR
jgi:hypothetical protein